MTLKISIAMTTYRGERHLREQLDSLAAQQRLPDEMVVCDDCSPDGTLAILERFAEQAPFPVHVHRNERNLGYIANYGRVLSLVEGDLVFLCDQDDVWFSDKLAVFEERAKQQPQALVFVCDAILCDANLKRGVRYSRNVVPFGAGPRQVAIGCCTAIRRELFPLILPVPDERLSHDVWIHQVADAIGRKAIIDRPLQLYRRHDINVSANSTHEIFGQSVKFRLNWIFESAVWDPVPRWQAHLKRLDRIRRRMVERRAELERLAGPSSAEDVFGAIDFEIDTILSRISIVQLGRRGRIGLILGLFRSGGYGRHRGLASALKDLVRPRSRIAGA